MIVSLSPIKRALKTYFKLKALYSNSFRSSWTDFPYLSRKSPFFKKNYSRETGIEKIWICSRAVRPVKFIYSYLYTPKSNTSMVIKEVDFEQEMSNLLIISSIPLVYLIRHPCGNILSHLKGQESAKMTTKRNQYLGKFMKKNAPDLYERHKGEIANMSVLEIVAWFWRISLDLGVKAIQESGRGKLLTYEQLCDDADGCAKSIFEYFGLSYPTVAQDFVAGLYASDASQSSGRKQDLMDGYFTVHRNPRKQKDAWKSKITSEQRNVIEIIVKDSPAFEYCAALGNWD